jgi:tetrahydrodipicolinate N-succinyltransferase
MKSTRNIKRKKLNQGKYEQLEEQAEELGNIRTNIWHEFGSISGVAIKSDRQIRDKWLKEKRQFKVLANAWKETLRDSFDDIKAYREAAKEKVRKIIYKNINKPIEFYKLLKSEH